MYVLKRMLILLTAIAGMMMFTAVSYATDYYIAQNAAGSNNGTNCANAYSASWFNTSSNWGSGAGQISAGDTVHLCGTFSGAANSTMLTVQGSGSAGNVITILFESGAVLTSPQWAHNGAIYISGQSYIKIDGGTNGIIKNTNNGSTASGLTYHADSKGILVTGSSNIEITNLSITNIFINTGGDSSGSSDSSGASSTGIRVEGPPYSYISIHNNTLSNSRANISFSLDSTTASTNINIYNNTISDNCWGIQLGAGNSNVSANTINIYNNTITNWTLWQYPTGTYHTDGIIVYADGSGSNVTGNIYNNYIYGNLGSGSPTAFIFLESNTKNFNVYNNLLVWAGGGSPVWLGGDICTGGGHNLYNNTIVGNGSGYLVRICNSATFKNNIFTNGNTAIMERPGNYNGITASDYNLFNTTYAAGDNDTAGPPAYLPLASWQSGYNQDLHSVIGNPLFLGSSNYQLQSGSPATGKGTNLTSLSITSLDYDKINVARPSLGAWDIGAYAFLSGTIQSVPPAKPNPPILRVN